MYAKRFTITAAALAAAIWVQPAAAAVVDLKFEDFGGASKNTQDFGPNVYHDWQNAFNAASHTNDYAFHFTYDTDASAPNYGLTLVSGRVGTFDDFSLWTPTLSFTAETQLMVSLTRTVVTGATSTRGVYFLLKDNDGDIGSTLPTAVTLANLDTASASFENRRNGGVGLGYKNVGWSRFGGVLETPQGSGDPNGGDGDDNGGGPVGAIPEPGTWALMILGFGSAGAMLRRRRAVLC